MQVPSTLNRLQISVSPLSHWHPVIRRVILSGAVVVVTGIYILLGVGLLSGLALAANALTQF